MRFFTTLIFALLLCAVAEATPFRLLETVDLPLVVEGKTVGSMKLPAGSEVEVISNDGTNAVIKRGGATYSIPSSSIKTPNDGASTSQDTQPSKRDDGHDNETLLPPAQSPSIYKVVNNDTHEESGLMRFLVVDHNLYLVAAEGKNPNSIGWQKLNVEGRKISWIHTYTDGSISGSGEIDNAGVISGKSVGVSTKGTGKTVLWTAAPVSTDNEPRPDIYKYLAYVPDEKLGKGILDSIAFNKSKSIPACEDSGKINITLGDHKGGNFRLSENPIINLMH